MTEILSSIGSIFTSAIGWAGKVGETVVGTPLLLLVGLGVGLFKRLLNV